MKYYCSIFLFLFYGISLAQSKIDCENLKSGVYFEYPKNTNDKYIYYRDNNIQQEINITTGDTAVWKIKWNNDCSYSLSFLESNAELYKKIKKRLKKHTLLYKIAATTEDYYIYSGYLNNSNGTFVGADTIWLKEKINPVLTSLFEQVSENATINTGKDSSKFALLYIYRPGKFTNFLANYPIYFNAVPMCIAKNNSGFVFKIFKEGTFEIKSQLFKDRSAIDLRVKFGNIYYVKSMIHWGIYRMLYNFKLEMKEVPVDEGKVDFEQLKRK